MGKANRIKNNKSTSVLAAPVAKSAEKKGMPTWAGTVIVITVLALLVLAVTLTSLSSRGVFKRAVIVAETENYKVNANMMSYLVHTEYWNMVNTYANLSQQIYPNGDNALPIPSGKGGTNLVQGVPLRDQIYSTQDENGNPADTVTWFDHFLGLAKTDLTEILASCEYANAAGIELGEKENKEIDASIDQLKAYAMMYGFEDVNGYFTYMYGKGVRERDVRKMMQLSSLAAKASAEKKEALFDAVIADRVNGEYTANQKDYDVYADWISYTFTATFTPSTKTGDEAVAENAKREAEYKALQDAYAAAVKMLAEDGEGKMKVYADAEAFSAALSSKLQEIFYAEEEKAAIAKLAEGETLTDAQKQTCTTTAADRAGKALKTATVTNGKTADLSGEAATWIKTTGDKAVKAGDVKKFESTEKCKSEKTDTTPEEYKKATSTYSVYYVKSGLHRDAGEVRSVGHILFKSETFDKISDTSLLAEPYRTLAKRIEDRGEKVSAESMAKELVALMAEEGALTAKTKADGTTYYEISKDAFEKYGLDYTEDSNVMYDYVAKGDMVEAFENWLFAKDRVAGEMSAEGVKTTYGYHIMFYVGETREAWEYTIREKLAEGDHEDWLESIKTTYTVTFTDKESKWNKVDDSTR